MVTKKGKTQTGKTQTGKTQTEKNQTGKTKTGKTQTGKTKTGKTQTEKLTPYQGTDRAFGKFQCSKCSKEWSSASSWSNTAQYCKDCNTDDKVYPYTQRKLERKKSRNNKEHLQQFCEMCQRLGFSCTKKTKKKK